MGEAGSGRSHKIIATGSVGQIKNIKLVSGLSTDLVSVGQLLDENDNINILLSKNAAYIVPKQLPPAHKKIESAELDGGSWLSSTDPGSKNILFRNTDRIP